MGTSATPDHADHLTVDAGSDNAPGIPVKSADNLPRLPVGGHCYLPEPNLIREAKILGVGKELIGPCLDELVASDGAVREPGSADSVREK